jgi:hypothetical protein
VTEFARAVGLDRRRTEVLLAAEWPECVPDDDQRFDLSLRDPNDRPALVMSRMR